MLSKDLTDYFYKNIVGHSVSDTNEAITTLTLQYLLENDLTETEIKSLLMSYQEEVVTPYNLPDILWIVNPKIKENKKTGELYEVNDNLVKRNEYYYHPCLMLRSKLPVIKNGKEVIEPYFCEPRCRFTVDHLIDYFCTKIGTHAMYMDTQYSVNSIFQNFRVYQNAITTIDPLDILLYSIDFAAEQGNYYFSTFMQLQQYLGTVIKEIQERIAYVRAFGYDKIVWRSDQCLLQSSEQSL